MVRASRKPTTVLLVRHGQTATTGRVLPGRAPGLHLSDDGRRQAEAATQRIAKLKRVAAVYASPLERARETAMPIARIRGLALRIERGLLELDVGSWTGSRLDRLSKRPEWITVQRYPSGFRFPEGESFVEMQARVTAALARMVEHHRGGVVVAVSHADPIKAALAHALGMHLDLFQRIAVEPAGLTAVRYTPTRPFLLRLNDTGAGLAALVAPRRSAKRGTARTRLRRSTAADRGDGRSDAPVGGGDAPLAAGDAPVGGGDGPGGATS
jgi:probable phosphomutase (TIGR03848 family)